MAKKKVLITAIGTATATAIVKILKDSGNYYLIGADINCKEEIATSKDVDEFIRFPYAVDPNYIEFALDFCRDNSISYYFAVIDKEVVKLSETRDQFERIGTKLCVANSEFVNMCHYKNRFGDWLECHYPAVAIHQYPSLKAARAASFPLFIKPVEGVASAGCKKVDSFEQLQQIITAEQVGTQVVVQDFTEGDHVVVDCVRNRETREIGLAQRVELLRNANGCGIATKIIDDPELKDLCIELVNALDLDGVANIELFRTSNGYKVIEINPRYSAGTLYSYEAGLDVVKNAILIADKKSCQFETIQVGARFAERYEVYRMQ